MTLTDPSRNRAIPVVIYSGPKPRRPRPLAIISNGYGIANTRYSFVAEALVARGYLVAAVQHDLPGDPPIASGANLYQRRLPAWRIGEASIGFVADELVRRGMADGQRGLVLVGHSNGGDITMLFARDQPKRVRAAISLDNRRMPLPRSRKPRICSARSADQPADDGVIPTPGEQQALDMVVVGMADLAHNDMTDAALLAQKRAMLDVIARCLPQSAG